MGPAGNIQAKVLEIKFPIKGIDRSTPLSAQPKGTTPDALNMRGYPPISDRSGGGGRAGFSKAFVDIAGSAISHRISHLISRNANTGASDSLEAVIDAFAAPVSAVGDGDLGANFVRGILDTNGQAKALLGGTGGTHFVAGAPNTVTFDRIVIAGVAQRPFLAVGYNTTNDVTAVFSFINQASNTSTNDGLAGECQRIGPFIRGSSRIGEFGYVARLIRGVDSAHVQLEIAQWANHTITQKAVGAALGLGVVGAATDATIRLFEDGGSITAELTWTTSGGSVFTPTVTGCSVSFSSPTQATNRRGGVMAANEGTAATTAAWRILKSISFVKIAEGDSSTVFKSLSGSSANPIDSRRFFLPTGWTSKVYTTPNTDGSALTPSLSEDGPATSAADPTYIAVDDTNNVIWDAATVTANFAKHIQPTAAPDASAGYVFEWQHIQAYAGADQDAIGAIFHLDSSGNGFYITPSSTTSDNGSVWRSQTNMVGVDDFFIWSVIAATLDSLTATGLSAGGLWDETIVRAGTWIRWTLTATTLTLSANGIDFITYTLTAGMLSALALMTGTNVAAQLRFLGDNANGASTAGIAALRVSYDPIVAGVDPTDATTSEVAVYTRDGTVAIGTLLSGTLQNTTGTGLINKYPSGFYAFGKFYAVDGSSSKITDPSTLTTTSWTSNHGVFPASCFLACLYRGRAVLAKTTAQPAVWFMSRIFDPRDFEYGGTTGGSIATSAVAGTDPAVGQPGDAIMALVPFGSDQLVFGCATEIYVMEGDPGYGGQIQNLTRQTGMVSSRSWCYDGAGTLYFLGQGGLFRYVGGGTGGLQNISGKRMYNKLERIDFSNTFVQMAFDKFAGSVHIFLTPTDGTTVGRHVIYDVPNDAFWEDQYPLEFGPWAATEIVGGIAGHRRIIIGGNDGYVRRPDDDVFDDDGTAISTSMTYAILSGPDTRRIMLTEMQAQLVDTSGPVTWRVFSGSSADETFRQSTGTERLSGEWGTAGRDGDQDPVRMRISDGALQLRLDKSNSIDRWGLDAIQMFVRVQGRNRRL